MVTFEYRNDYFIHDYFNLGRVEILTPSRTLIRVKSVHAAKCLITRMVNANNT